MIQSNTLILTKLGLLERDLQELKLAMYTVLPKRSRSISPYAENALMEASKSAREDIWQGKYAKQIKSLS